MGVFQASPALGRQCNLHHRPRGGEKGVAWLFIVLPPHWGSSAIIIAPDLLTAAKRIVVVKWSVGVGEMNRFQPGGSHAAQFLIFGSRVQELKKLSSEIFGNYNTKILTLPMK